MQGANEERGGPIGGANDDMSTTAVIFQLAGQITDLATSRPKAGAVNAAIGKRGPSGRSVFMVAALVL